MRNPMSVKPQYFSACIFSLYIVLSNEKDILSPKQLEVNFLKNHHFNHVLTFLTLLKALLKSMQKPFFKIIFFLNDKIILSSGEFFFQCPFSLLSTSSSLHFRFSNLLGTVHNNSTFASSI